MEEFSGRARGRRQRKRGWGRTIAVLVVGVAVVWFGWTSLFSGSGPKKSATVNVDKPRSKSARAKTAVTQRTFVVLGIDENQGQKTVKGAIGLVYDPARNKIGGLIVDPNTYVSIPGRGFQSIHDGAAEGPKNLEAAIAEVVGVESEGYVTLPGDVFTDIVDNKKAGDIFDRYVDGSLSRSAAKSLAAKLSNIPAERVSFIGLPVKTIVIGEQTYYEPDKADLERLVLTLWARRPKQAKSPIKVIILNGSGTPGIARVAADRLLGKSFKILDVKNADKFTYAKTEILIYTEKAKKSGATIAKALGAGVVIDKKTAQDVTDIVIVIGKDFH